MHFEAGGIDASFDIQCTFKALHIIPITAVGVDIKNLVFDGKLQFDAEDPVHWQIADLVTSFSVDDVKITTGGHISQFLVNTLSKMISGAIDKALKEKLPAMVSAAVDQLNEKVMHEGPYGWDVKMFGGHSELNMTMARVPNVKKDYFQMSFDGTYHKPNGVELQHPAIGEPPLILTSHREQFWLHASTFNTLLSTFTPDRLSGKFGHVDFAWIALNLPSIASHYG